MIHFRRRGMTHSTLGRESWHAEPVTAFDKPLLRRIRFHDFSRSARHNAIAAALDGVGDEWTLQSGFDCDELFAHPGIEFTSVDSHQLTVSSFLDRPGEKPCSNLPGVDVELLPIFWTVAKRPLEIF